MNLLQVLIQKNDNHINKKNRVKTFQLALHIYGTTIWTDLPGILFEVLI